MSAGAFVCRYIEAGGASVRGGCVDGCGRHDPDPKGTMMAVICVLTGGGIKGAVAAARSREEGDLVLLHFDYGQPSAKAERVAAEALTGWLTSAKLVRVDVPAVARLATGHTGATDRAGGNAAMSPGAMRGQLPVILSTAAQYALRIGAGRLVTGFTAFAEGAHLGLAGADTRVDGRREMLHAFSLMLNVVAADGVKPEWPLIDLRYSEILKLGLRFGVPLDMTWTCGGSGPRPCGSCDPCRARARAFAEAREADPLLRDTTTAAV